MDESEYMKIDAIEEEKCIGGIQLPDGDAEENPITQASYHNESIELVDTINDIHISSLHQTNVFQTLMLLVKSNIGTGILAMGLAIKRSGIIVGPIFMLLLSIPIIHCMHLLLDITKLLKIKNYSKDKFLGYDDIADLCMSPFIGDKSYIAGRIINVFLCIAQFGFCSAYFVFISQTLYQLTECTFGDVRIWVIIVTLPVIPLSLVKNMRGLSIISSIANVISLFGIGGMLFYIFSNLKNPSNYPFVAPFKDQPLFLASVLFAFEGINVVLPIWNNMENKNKFKSTLNASMLIVFAIYLAVGFMGYLAFGDSIRGNITLNLPNTPFYFSIKICYAVAIFLTLFIQFYIPAEIIIQPIARKFSDSIDPRIIDMSFRTFLISLIAMFAVLVPKLDNVINLIGSLVCSFLSLIFPPFFHSMACFIYLKPNSPLISSPSERRIIKLKIFKNMCIIVLGLFGCIIGLYTTVEQIVVDMNSGNSTLPGCSSKHNHDNTTFVNVQDY